MRFVLGIVMAILAVIAAFNDQMLGSVYFTILTTYFFLASELEIIRDKLK